MLENDNKKLNGAIKGITEETAETMPDLAGGLSVCFNSMLTDIIKSIELLPEEQKRVAMKRLLDIMDEYKQKFNKLLEFIS